MSTYSPSATGIANPPSGEANATLSGCIGNQSTLGSPAPTHANQNSQDHWIGKRLGEYIIEELLGYGGNGRVYQARHRSLDLPVAIKMLNGLDPNDQQVIDRFRREAMVAAKLIHPNLVRATDACISGEHIFLVTDLVNGSDLHKLIQKNGPCTLAQAASIICDAANGLEYISSEGIVHRDIKPSNIMVDRTGQVRILDLGLAKCSERSNAITATGQVMGTLDYLAPEQATNPRSVDFRADIYSLGCTLYYLLAGQPPFPSEADDTLASKLLAHLEKEAVPIRVLRKDVPRDVERLLEQMLAKKPEDRPESFSKIVDTLKPYRDSASLLELHSQQSESIVIASHSDSQKSIIQTMGIKTLCALGVLEKKENVASPIPVYQFSFAWLQLLIGITAVASIAIYIGIGQDVDSPEPTDTPNRQSTQNEQPTIVEQPTPLAIRERGDELDSKTTNEKRSSQESSFNSRSPVVRKTPKSNSNSTYQLPIVIKGPSNSSSSPGSYYPPSEVQPSMNGHSLAPGPQHLPPPPPPGHAGHRPPPRR
ncbi:MAG: serine/threonine-protein kinase [Planctomycetota bacterium]